MANTEKLELIEESAWAHRSGSTYSFAQIMAESLISAHVRGAPNWLINAYIKHIKSFT